MTAKHGDIIVDGGVAWRVVDSRINGYIADNPNFYERSGLFVPNKTTITTPDKMLININNHGYIGSSVTINLNSASSWDAANTTYATLANRAGKDFYIYVVEQDGDVPKFLLSTHTTCPYEYTETNSRKVGGFHCLCASVGTISGHTLSGYYAGEILPLSVWDLKHRPVSEPEGMVYIAGLGKWYDIYLNSWDGLKLVSKYGGTTADGSSSPTWHGEKFAEKLGEIAKSLPSRNEFMVFAKGSNEKTAISGSKDWGTTGGHVDTANRRMISNYGLEDCCGFLIQWTSDTYTQQSGSWGTGSVYSSSVDSQEYGSSYGNTYRALVGGSWYDSSRCGSRYVYFDHYSSHVSAYYGARGSSEPLKYVQ